MGISVLIPLNQGLFLNLSDWVKYIAADKS